METLKNNRLEWENTEAMYYTTDSIGKFLKLFDGEKEIEKEIQRGKTAVDRIFQLTNSNSLFFLFREEKPAKYVLRLTENYWETQKKKVLENKNYTLWNPMVLATTKAVLKKPEYRGYGKQLELKRMFGESNLEQEEKKAWAFIVEKEMEILELSLEAVSEYYKN